jgi:hypothetical protein
MVNKNIFVMKEVERKVGVSSFQLPSIQEFYFSKNKYVSVIQRKQYLMQA